MIKKWLGICFIFGIFSLFITQPVFATIIFDGNTSNVDIHDTMAIYEDKSGELSIEEISSSKYTNKFQKNEGGIPSYGYKNSVFWLKFAIKNTGYKDEMVLEIPYSPHDSIIVYEMTEQSYNKYEGGDLLPFRERARPHRHVTFDLDIPINEERTYYVRIQSEGSLQLPVVLWRAESFADKGIKEYFLLGGYYGIALAMITYNLFLYVSLRFRSYLWYVFVLIGICLTQLTFNGLAYQFLWPDLPWWNNRSIVFSMAISCIAGSIFVNKFLNVKGFSEKLSRFLNYSIFLNISFIVILMFDYPLALYLVSTTFTVYVIFILGITFYSWRKGNTFARFLFFGWFVFLFCSLISVLADSGIITVNAFTSYIAMYGSVFEMTLFSLALGERMKMIQKDKEIAEKQALVNQEIAIKNLEKADKLKDEFIANTTHELKTPLHGMIGIAESLRDGIAGEPNQLLKRNLSLIIQSGYRLLNLINDILDYSKLKTHEIQLNLAPVRLQDAVSVVLTLNEPLLKNKNVKLINDVSPDIPIINADENRILQILHNLIGNAIKFTLEGTVTVSAYKDGDFVTVQITDTGIGIHEDELDEVFNEFEQGSNVKNIKQSGTGIGLSITKNLVQLHGGEISIESEMNKGTTVTFTVPIYENADSTIATTFEMAKPTPIENKNIISYREGKSSEGKILVVDDDPINIQVLMNHLNLKLPNFQIVIAEDGEEALSIIERDANFDLIILDLMMPKKSGYEVCAEIRQKYSITELPVLILTARSNLDDMVTAFRVGANDYLIKPYFKEELFARVETLLTLKKVMMEIVEKTKELNDLNKELELRVQERTKELEAKTEDLFLMESSRRHLLANISHDIGTPLTSIQGYVKAMLDDIIEPSRHYLEVIYDKSLYINRLLDDLHDLSTLEAKKASFHMEDVVINDFVFEFLNAFETDITTKNFQFKLKNELVEDELSSIVKVDLDRIRQVVENLVSNAFKYTTENGFIYFEVYELTRLKSNKQFSEDVKELMDLFHKERYIVLAIRDNGSGIESESLTYIFNRYYRGDSNEYYDYKNIGLGLAIVKEIVDYHEGAVWVESEKGVGSSFYIALPFYKK